MLNPGTLPDRRLTGISNPDITAVCEESLTKYRNWGAREKVALNEWDPSRCCIILHTVPQYQIPPLVRELRHRASYLYLTELGPGTYYQEWGAGWGDFVDAMAMPDP